MKGNTTSLILILAGGFIIDLGFLYIFVSKSKALTMVVLGAILFWNGFTRLT